ncbi:hypothetical protein G9C98_007262 [Cotesia typhae]|uniref:Calponin-homology (CH) domain-containing protein n=1 Tax=Cotesia typhae TaxID=2053667 RepID=A0A8J5VCG0_9HYME|nr:hypothetical protein G9C98_007262 [Cotesia typhae]
MASSEIDDFLSGPLVTWFGSCLEDPDALANYYDLVDGMLLHNVFLQIDPEPLHDGVIPSYSNPSVRIKNLEMIISNIRKFYEEDLGYLVIKLPDPVKLGKEPELHVSEIHLLLQLLLGCAVHCPNKKDFITKIFSLPEIVQSGIADCIKNVTEMTEIVINQDTMGDPSEVFKLMKQFLHERDFYRGKCKSTMSGDLSGAAGSPSQDESAKNQQSNAVKSDQENHHFAVELADWKSKIRKQRHELEEKTEALAECKEELEHIRATVAKLKQENQELMHEARAVKTYRDELDAMMQKAERVDKLEAQVLRYQEKISDIDFYKIRVEELREDNRMLMENREMLEDQLNIQKRRAEKAFELESEIIKYKALINDMNLERAAEKEKYQELQEENSQLHKLKKAADDEAARASVSESEESVSDNRLSEQLTSNAQTRALKLELENRRLTALVDSLKENSFHESSSRLLELEKEKKRLSLKIDSLTDNNERLLQQNADLESVCKQALEENKKLQNTLKNQRMSFERQQQDYQTQHTKIVEMENNYETVVKEKQRVQSLLESVQRRADELDRSLESANQKLDEYRNVEKKLKDSEVKCNDLEAKILALEKDKDVALRDVHKYREAIEEKDVAIDKSTNTIEVLEKKIQELDREIDNSNAQIVRLQEIERSSKELDARAAIDKETLETLESNLIAEKMNTQQIHAALDKLGLTVDVLLSLSAENFAEKLINLPEVAIHINKLINESSKNHADAPVAKEHEDEEMKPLKEHIEMVEALKKDLESTAMKLIMSESTAESLLEEQAKLQVSVTTLTSKNSSLNAQCTTLQLSNSQLVAEKEELLKDREIQQRTHQQLLHDQVTLQSLHEQLNNEYENLVQERENLKTNLRDIKTKERTWKETCERLESKNKILMAEQEASATHIKSLNNLRGEHSKLKDDFRNLYSAMEKLKIDYRSLQEDYKKNKIESNRLNLKLTELQGELSIKDESYSNMELQNSKLNQRCEMLAQMNSGLDNNRRSLMDHVSVLLNQYQDLLTHSLEDKEHYHMEEKIYRDQVNHLSRQKEKLEEKIMEYYRNKQSCSTKKKRFGANLVKRVRKAGSELLHKNRQSWTEDSRQDSKIYESESGGNDSDISVDERRASLDPTAFDNDSLSLGHAGTRRTVYYTDDFPSPTSSLTHDSKLSDTLPIPSVNDTDGPSNLDTSRTEARPGESRPFLIYNKISAVINEPKNTIVAENSTPNDEIPDITIPVNKDGNSKVGNSIWYEYGCV